MKAQPFQVRFPALRGHFVDVIRRYGARRPDWKAVGLILEKALVSLGEAELYCYYDRWPGVFPDEGRVRDPDDPEE